jgi:S1-C subfamily serine protease
MQQRKVARYSSAGQPRGPARAPLSARRAAADGPAAAAARAAPAQGPAAPADGAAGHAAAPAGKPPGRLRRLTRRFEKPLLVLAGAAFAILLTWIHGASAPGVRQITQEDIDNAVLNTLETKTLPSRATKAYDAVKHSVVRVRGWESEVAEEGEKEQQVGSGVVIVDKGIILTNLHVVAGAKRISVTFADGLESDATIISAQPDNDLAVLRAKQIPDDLVAATLGSTANLAPGDDVVAVGFPFGIGPSVSAGVVSGLGREYRSPEGKNTLKNLIQFDAAANPGSSGGPLVNAEGEVVGIVTGILNPTDQRVFIGIGFAVTIESAGAAVGIPPF